MNLDYWVLKQLITTLQTLDHGASDDYPSRVRLQINSMVNLIHIAEEFSSTH